MTECFDPNGGTTPSWEIPLSLFAAILAFTGLTPAPVAPPPLPRRRRASGATPAAAPPPAPVAPLPLPRFDHDALLVPERLPAATAIRILEVDARRCQALEGLAGKGRTVANARWSLGPDIAAYYDLCIAAGQPIPSQSIAHAVSGDAAYRARLRRASLADLDLWERARLRHERERLEALEDRRPAPEPMHVPPDVLAALAQRSAARAAERSSRDGTTGARAHAPPRRVQSTPPEPPAGPKR